MWLLSMIAFLLLGGYLLLSAMRFGIPDMVSDTYYQLQGCTGSEVIGGKRKRNYGWVFSVLMVVCAGLMMVCLLDVQEGVQCLAFIGCAGLCFVGVAPNYCDKDTYPIHKGGAIVAAVGCVGWCLSINVPLTIIIAAITLLFLWWSNKFVTWEHYLAKRDGVEPSMSLHPWYWLEVAGFLDVFLTYWLSVCL